MATVSSRLRSLAYFGLHTSYHALLCNTRISKSDPPEHEVEVCLGNELVRYRLIHPSALPQQLQRVSHRRMHDAVISDVMRSPAHGLVASCCYDDRLRIWDEKDGNYHLLACESGVNLRQTEPLVLDQVCWSPSGRYLATTTKITTGVPRGRLQVWDFKDSKLTEICRVEGNFQRAIFNKQDQVVTFRRGDNGVSLWTIDGGTLREAGSLTLQSSPPGITTIGTNPTCTAFTCCTRGKTLVHVDALALKVTLEVPSEASRNVGSVLMLDEERVLFAPRNGQFLVWNVATGVREQVVVGPPGNVLVLALASGNRLVSATVDGLFVQTVPVKPLTVPAAASQPKMTCVPRGLQFHSIAGCGIDISCEGRFLATGDLGCKLAIWHLGHNLNRSEGLSPAWSGHDFHPVSLHHLPCGVRCVKWLPWPNHVLVGGLDGQLFLLQFSEKTGKTEAKTVFQATAAINCIEVRPGHDRNGSAEVIVVDSAGFATLLLVSPESCTGRCSWLAHPPVHSTDPEFKRNFGSLHRAADVWSCIWSPDGQILATCSEDQSTRIWDMRCEVPRLLQVLRGHTTAVTCLDWSVQDGRQILATCADDQRLMLWECKIPPVPETKTQQGYCRELTCAALAVPGTNSCDEHSPTVCRLLEVFNPEHWGILGWFTFTYMRSVGSQLIAGTENGYVVVLDVLQRKVLHSRCIHRGSIEGLCSHSSGAVATISSDCSIAFHHIHDGATCDVYGHSHL